MYRIEFYETESGDRPVEKFLNELEPKMKAKAIRELDILAELGPRIREPYSKDIGHDICELRVKFSSNIIRVFYFFFVGGKIILLNGFIKKTQKTPHKEIDRAIQHKEDYERRLGK